MNDWLGRLRQFISDTMAELRKCSWPNRSELFEQTLLVIFSVIVLGAFVAGIDAISRALLNLITGING